MNAHGCEHDRPKSPRSATSRGSKMICDRGFDESGAELPGRTGRDVERALPVIRPPGSGVDGMRARYDVAPTARAIWRHVESQGKLSGKCRTMRRTEHSTHTASLISRSRRVVTWASAQPVPA